MGFKQKLVEKNYSIFVLVFFLISLFQKLRLITIVEYKYDQAFANNVLRSCSLTKVLNLDFDFLFIKSSVGIPQGPFHYTLECISGILGVNDYIQFLRFKIIFLQLLIFLIFKILKKYFSKKQSVAFLLLILFNPYLIISSRNISSVYNYEFIILFFIFFYINFNKNKRYSFVYGLISTLVFAFYFPLFIFAGTLNIVLLLLGRIKFKINIFLGSLFGLFISFISYLPYLSTNNFINLTNSNQSWGLTSYWRININALSGNSLKNKINSPYDIETLQLIYPNYLLFHNLNKIIITFLIIYSLYGLLTSIKTRNVDNIDIVFLTLITVTGIVFTLINNPLYPHYFFFNIFFSIIFIVRKAKNQNVLLILSIIFFILSNVVINNFHSYIEINKGATNSDYGISYINCGCCVEDARLCRGQ